MQISKCWRTNIPLSAEGNHPGPDHHYYLTVWNVATRKQRFETYPGDWVGMLCFTPDGQTIASRRRSRLIKLWNARDGQVLGLAEGHTLEITALAISRDGREIAS
jgi:WD40 repeat protein